MYIKEITLLGYLVSDKVTNFKGIVTLIGVDINGNIRALVQPSTNDKNEIPEPQWFDTFQLVTLSGFRSITPANIVSVTPANIVSVTPANTIDD